MAKREPVTADAFARAEALVSKAEQVTSNLPAGVRGALVAVLAKDLRAGREVDLAAEERLLWIETQTRVCAEALIAITDIADIVRPAVDRMRASMVSADAFLTVAALAPGAVK
jgi:hypothetical protein